MVLGLNATLTLALSFSLVKSLRGGKANGMDYPYARARAGGGEDFFFFFFSSERRQELR